MHACPNGKHCGAKQTPRLGRLVWLYTSVFPLRDQPPPLLPPSPPPPPPPLSLLQCVADKLLTPIQKEEKKNHYFKSVWLFVRGAQDGRAEDSKVQAVLIDLCSPLISLTGSWFIEMGPRVNQGYGSKHPAWSPALRVAWNWGQLTVWRTHALTIPYTSYSLLINACFEVGQRVGGVGGGRLGGKKEGIRG